MNILDEHDACAIVSAIEKERIATKYNIDLVLNALEEMHHRAGFVNGEGDGVGIQIDVPKALWKEKLKKVGKDPLLIDRNDFVIGHFFIRKGKTEEASISHIYELLKQFGYQVLFTSTEVTSPRALGSNGKLKEPTFLQIAMIPLTQQLNQQAKLFELIIDIEKDLNVHVVSLSADYVVYKVLGSCNTLKKYYQDLSSPLLRSTMTLGHNRYSTNTLSSFFRIQPFHIIGHNGEINTIAKLRDEANLIGVPLVKGGSDSQDLDRTLATLILKHDYSLFEAMEILFPPIINEMNHYKNHLKELYAYLRESFGHFAQGPAGIVSRSQDEAVFSVDALGLRPLWKLEIESTYLFSSEPGIVKPSEHVRDPHPLSPGEKIGLKYSGNSIEVYDYRILQEEVYTRFTKRIKLDHYSDHHVAFENVNACMKQVEYHDNGIYHELGWRREHIQVIQRMAKSGTEPIRSLGHDVALAAIEPHRKNIADFIKESVAVVTNPAIDREREVEHFSTRIFIGERPNLFNVTKHPFTLKLPSPILIDIDQAEREPNSPTYTQVLSLFEKQRLTHTLYITLKPEETIESVLTRLTKEAIDAVKGGKTVLVLDDSHIYEQGDLWLDPHLVVSAINQSLLHHKLRRQCSIILKSGAIRSLHDFMVAYGLGANAINPYLLFEVARKANNGTVRNLYQAMKKGIEKVISTIGIHELRGYGRLFSSIGLHPELAERLTITNYFGSRQAAYNFDSLKTDAIKRHSERTTKETLTSSFHVLPRLFKPLSKLAESGSYDDYRDIIDETEQTHPTTIRHLTEFKMTEHEQIADDVTISIDDHQYPFVIASMSFGSQNEIAFRAYAEAANRLGMISLNGEGGEIKDLLGKYKHTRGQQIASGRFGVNVDLLHSSNLIEIKIGQGAKPGEGGHLPGSKVTKKVAEARNATIGSDLISPSNNHDIYSIEDLEQVITEIKTVNDRAKVAVKVPVVPNIGTIAVGIAKAGADIITLSGFDGGTGAARMHAIEHVGLPVEIGIKKAHQSLTESGLRQDVELWADGGIKSANDIVKVMMLGANRVCFGTLAMIAIGCTACRGCHKDTCHVGIATQLESIDEARKVGVKRFKPRDYDESVARLVRLFSAFGNEIKQIVGRLGFTNLQDLVGRSDLMIQTRGKELLELQDLLKIVKPLKKKSSNGMTKKRSEPNLNEIPIIANKTAKNRVEGGRETCYYHRNLLSGNPVPPSIHLDYHNSILGNGLGAYLMRDVSIEVRGGSQDGVGKMNFGGTIHVMKSRGNDGKFYNGSVGKGFGYGAQSGLLLVQGNADARAGIRLSGADLIIGGQVKNKIPEVEHGHIGINANIKGFAFEYMTNGRGLVLGDPGPWLGAGMTGGVIYLRHQKEMGLTKEAIRRRIAKGAQVSIEPLEQKGCLDVEELLTLYRQALIRHEQVEEAERISLLIEHPDAHFVKVVPIKHQVDDSLSTE